MKMKRSALLLAVSLVVDSRAYAPRAARASR